MAGLIQGHIRKHGMERQGANPGWIQSQPSLSCPPSLQEHHLGGEGSAGGVLCPGRGGGTGLGVTGKGHGASGQGGMSF